MNKQLLTYLFSNILIVSLAIAGYHFFTKENKSVDSAASTSIAAAASSVPVVAAAKEIPAAVSDSDLSHIFNIYETFAQTPQTTPYD